ncbi:MAG TPA: hypothetical protein VKB38_06365 [Terracidiphilus sp.]|nr:hypothetical protein [Terracidiphilus sp.]
MISNGRKALALALVAFMFGSETRGLEGASFTQSGVGLGFANVIPMGHEWVTRMAASEVLQYPQGVLPDVPDPNDPRRGWSQGLARNPNLNTPGAQEEARRIKSYPEGEPRYASRYKFVWDAIIGERWVDIAGYNIITSKLSNIDCWDAVAQEAVEAQYDHFMRRWDETGGQGGLSAAKNSQARFKQYFISAAMAPSTTMMAYDGGAAGSTAVIVDRNYFLFGRAVHLFQDSFSTEHTVRLPNDNFVKVRQVKSYLCAPGSEQHSHSNSAVLNYTSGDVIWKPDTKLDPSWRSYKASNMKPFALVAVEGTKDLWAAFIRTMGKPMDQRLAWAQNEAQTLADNWLGVDDNEVVTWYDNAQHRGTTYVRNSDKETGMTVTQCMRTLNVGTDDQRAYAAKLVSDQRACVYNAIPWPGYDDLYDTSVHMYYVWQWRNNLKLETPPNGWQIPTRPADTGVRVLIKSMANHQYMTAEGGLKPDAWIYNRQGAALDMIWVGKLADDRGNIKPNDGSFRMTYAPQLFLSYRLSDGALKLYDPGALIAPSDFTLARAPREYSIKSNYWNQFVNLNRSTASPYINRFGDPNKAESQWAIEGLRLP